MRSIVLILFLMTTLNARAQQPGAPQNGVPSTKESKMPAAEAAPQEEKIEPPRPSPAPASASALPNEPGRMEPGEVQALLHKIWLAEYRTNDLLSQVHPDRWKLESAAGGSFDETLHTLRNQMGALEDWRGQFEKRTDSMYLGYQTYVAISAVLPRLDGVARSVSQFENESLGAQYSQAGNRLFDLQQAIVPYLSYLMRNQDQLSLAMQTNLASCQNELGYAMRSRLQPAIPMKNVLPSFQGHPHSRPSEKPAGRKNKETPKGATKPISPGS